MLVFWPFSDAINTRGRNKDASKIFVLVQGRREAITGSILDSETLGLREIKPWGGRGSDGSI